MNEIKDFIDAFSVSKRNGEHLTVNTEE